MIPIIARGSTGYFSNISTLIGISPLEQEALAEAVYNPQNVGEILYVQSTLDEMRDYAYNLIPMQAETSPDNEQFIYLIRHGLKVQEGYTGTQSNQTTQIPFVVAGNFLRNESFDSEGTLTPFEHALLNTKDKIFYFDHNGVRINSEDPDNYAYAYAWKGVGSDLNEDRWEAIFSRKQLISGSNYYTAQIECYIDNVDVELIYSEATSSANPMSQWDYRVYFEPFRGFELISDPGQALDMAMSAAFVSR